MADMEQRRRWAQEKKHQYRKLKEKGYVRVTVNLSPDTIAALDQYCTTTGASRPSAIDTIVRHHAARIAASTIKEDDNYDQHPHH